MALWYVNWILSINWLVVYSIKCQKKVKMLKLKVTSSNVLFWLQPKDIQFTTTEE